MTLDSQIKALADDMALNPVSGFSDPRIYRLNVLLTQQADAKRSAERAERALADWQAVSKSPNTIIPRTVSFTGESDFRCPDCGKLSRRGVVCCDNSDRPWIL